MTVFVIDPLQDPRWKAFIENRPDASVFHRVEWLQALRACYGYEPVAISTSPPGAPLQNALVSCAVRSGLTGDRFVSLPFSDTCEPLVNDPEEISLLLTYMAEKVNRGRWKYVEIRPMLHHALSCRLFAVSETYYSHQLDITRSEEDLFKSFHKASVQRKIRRAQRELLSYEVGCTDNLLKDFYTLLIMTRRRQNLPPQPLKWFRRLMLSMGEALKIRVARKGQIPVASILTISNNKTLVYKYGCSDSRYGNLGGTTMLFWNAIREAKAAGVDQLDMGRSAPDNVGLVTYKEHWGAKRSIIHYWRYPAQAPRSISYRALDYLRPVISAAPDPFLVTFGTLLYRHIG